MVDDSEFAREIERRRIRAKISSLTRLLVYFIAFEFLAYYWFFYEDMQYLGHRAKFHKLLSGIAVYFLGPVAIGITMLGIVRTKLKME